MQTFIDASCGRSSGGSGGAPTGIPIETRAFQLQERGIGDWKQERALKLSSSAEFPTDLETARWPQSGKHILAQTWKGKMMDEERGEEGDVEAVLVYQAYNAKIAAFAAAERRFDGAPGFSGSRMTWIKTNFLWMMYRSDWGHKDPNQERTLAIWLKKSAFERYLDEAVHSKFIPEVYGTKEKWNALMRKKQAGTVRLQWDPDHGPRGNAHAGRRAIQLGLREMRSFTSGEDILDVVDITEFVERERANALGDVVSLAALTTPLEKPYIPASEATCRKLGLEGFTGQGAGGTTGAGDDNNSSPAERSVEGVGASERKTKAGSSASHNKHESPSAAAASSNNTGADNTDLPAGDESVSGMVARLRLSSDGSAGIVAH